MDFIEEWYFLVPAYIIVIILVIYLVQWLWNSTLSEVCNFKKITFFQAFKIMLLAFLLTGKGAYTITTQEGVSQPSDCKESCTITQTKSETKSIKLFIP